MFKTGDIVRIKKDWCESTTESFTDYIVLEDWGNKVKIITKLDNMMLPNVNVVSSDMIYKRGSIDCCLDISKKENKELAEL